MVAAEMSGNCASFNRVEENKTVLSSFLSGILHELFQLADKELVITKGDNVLSKQPLLETADVAPCNHEEANSCLILHAPHTA